MQLRNLLNRDFSLPPTGLIPPKKHTFQAENSGNRFSRQWLANAPIILSGNLSLLPIFRHTPVNLSIFYPLSIRGMKCAAPHFYRLSKDYLCAVYLPR
jgi:hypothetical protein